MVATSSLAGAVLLRNRHGVNGHGDRSKVYECVEITTSQRVKSLSSAAFSASGRSGLRCCDLGNAI